MTKQPNSTYSPESMYEEFKESKYSRIDTKARRSAETPDGYDKMTSG